MGRHSLEYPKDATNKVKRHSERGKSFFPPNISISNFLPY